MRLSTADRDQAAGAGRAARTPAAIRAAVRERWLAARRALRSMSEDELFWFDFLLYSAMLAIALGPAAPEILDALQGL